MEMATLHRLFPGRVDVAVGHGVQDWMAQVGARADSPMTLLREYLAAIHFRHHVLPLKACEPTVNRPERNGCALASGRRAHRAVKYGSG